MSVKIYSKKLNESDSNPLENFLSEVEHDLNDLIRNGWVIINSSIYERRFIATLMK